MNAFDFSLSTTDLNETVYHIASKNDHYYLIDILAKTNSNIFMRDKNYYLPRQVSCHTLIVLSTLKKIENKTISNTILSRRVNFMQKYAKQKVKNKTANSSWKVLNKFWAESNVHFVYGPLFAHFLMNKDQVMKEVDSVKPDGTSIKYFKSASIMSYSDIMRNNWYDVSKLRRKKLVTEWLIKHDNISSELILSNKKLIRNMSSSQTSVSTSSQLN